MGASSLDFRGRSMDYRDPVMEVLLRLVILEIDKIKSMPSWLKELRDDWQIIATEEFGFGTIPDLKPLLIDDERRELILKLIFKAFEHLKSFGDPIPMEILNSLESGKPESYFGGNPEAKFFIKAFEDFIRLLE